MNESAQKFDGLMNVVAGIRHMPYRKLETVVSNMIDSTNEYIKANKLKSLVVGISGGLDSAVVAAILQEKNTGVPLIGISIPMNSSEDHKEKARWVGEEYCSAFEEFTGWENSPNDYDDDYLYGIIDSTLGGTHSLAKRAGFDDTTFPNNILQGNIKARLRMITLYDLARKTNGMVLSTDNYSEYLAGFWTINGDVGDYGIIQNVWKGFELPQIAEFMGVRDDIITQEPSDGLMVTDDNTDEAQLGMNYREFDTIMSIYKSELGTMGMYERDILFGTLFGFPMGSPEYLKVKKAIDRFNGTRYKRVGTTNLTRTELGIDFHYNL